MNDEATVITLAPHPGFSLAPTGGRGQAVFEALRTALREGRLKPGDPLREEEVAGWYGVSRTPVREAFARLISKSLLEHAGGRGLVVRRLRASEVFELYAMREVLEGAAASLAATHASPSEIDAIERLQQRFSALQPGEADAAARLNQRFHDAIHACARNRYLDSALEEMADGIALLGTTTLADTERHRRAIVEHGAVLEAIRRGDAAGAERSARVHIRAALEARESDMVD